MKTCFFRSMVASVLMLVPTLSMAQDFNAGLKAARAGDFETALIEWKPLAEQGDDQAQYNLGSMYSEGLGVPLDYAEGVRWFKLAAEQGMAEALYAVGRVYHLGQGVPQDDKETVKWYLPAAEQGDFKSQYMLGILHASGQGVPQDDKEAMKWYRLAAAQGVGVAQNNIGIMYANGEGVLQDDHKAYMWFHIAIANGLEESASMRDDIGQHMRSADIAEAQRRADVCIASNYQDCDRSTASAQQEEYFAQQEEYDIQRQNDILAISDMIEAYYEINNHYPWVKEPQLETINIFISDNIPGHYPPSAPYQLLEAELQKSLGNDIVLPIDPSGDGIPYQYATNGSNYYVAAYLYHKRSYAWEQERHANKVEVTNRPRLQNRSYRPGYLRHVIEFGPDDANRQAEFIEALQEHNFDAAAVMLKSGANPSPTCEPNYRCQPLATAAMNGDLEIMKFLIDNGADLDGYNSYDDVALIYALENQQIEAAKLLVESGANVNIPNAFGISPFIGAPASGDLELVASMIQNGAELDKSYLLSTSNAEPGQKNRRPLEMAISMNQPEIISLLLGAGANPSLKTSRGETIEELGRESENEAIRELF